jgi:MFS family permease
LTAAGSDYGRTVSVLAFGQLVSWAALYYGFSSFVLPMQEALGWSKSLLMGALTLALAVWGLLSYTVGGAIDRGHARLVMSLGSVIGGLGFLVWALASQPWMLYVACALLGAAMAMTLYDPAFIIVTRKYPGRYRQAITAITLSGGFASTLSFPAAVGLIHAMGWRWALVLIAAILLLVIAPLHAWALKGSAALVLDATTHGASDAQPDDTLASALRMRAFWLIAATFTLYSFAAAALWAHVMPALASKGFSDAQAIAIVVWVGPAQVAGRFVFSLLGHSVPVRTLGLFVLAGLPISLALFAWGESTASLIFFAVLFGLANGLVTIVRGSLVPDYFGRSQVGRIGGAISSIALLARAAAPLAAAWILLWPTTYDGMMGVLSVLGAVSLVSFAAARRPPHRK